MDNIPLRLRSFKLHLIIPKNLRARLAKTITMIYVPRASTTVLEINGAQIPPNKPAPIVLGRAQLAEAESDTEVMYESSDQVFASDGLRFEVNFYGEKSLKGFFQRDERWGLKCELIGMNMWMEITVMTDPEILIRERVKLRRNRFCQNLSVIQEEDEQEMAELNYLKDEHENNNRNEVVNKGVSWAINIGILVAVLGAGLFSLKRLVR